ncbi:membrane-associated tyrosine- and threonine-specific cdc2-inhibitory kinase [Anthonomus grandis grandis]|uniref:membrane-associated tyrosine- and threonine-specific cdc2-inhibitory kinase n=1 Tax=Anthonomus grandis grandis TaxID=2921223 RepID=UPI002166AF27|nr:membrane-associated tyrosine- and threonine-specific cdc2-inhibitory kinase [Anthonomus grandis grandis]
MNRKRGFGLEELHINERLSTKKELAERGHNRSCPGPIKIRRNISSKSCNKKLTLLCFNNNATLSPAYNPNEKNSYLDQVFTKHGCLGEGSFGKVYRVRSKEDKKLYAVKWLKANISFKDRRAEVKNNETIGFNENCVQYFMAWEENCDTFMQLEYCDMSLADYSKLNSDIHEELLWNVLYDISKALNFLHKKNLLHLDVKPGNIMMRKGVFKLGDFGLLVDLQGENQVLKSTLSDGDSKYLAVEVLEGIYTSSCDIFGLGLSILELATDIELPEYGMLWHQLRSMVLPPMFYTRVSKSLQKLVEKMLQPEYKLRPSAETILLFPKLGEIAKRDERLEREDFAAPYIKSDNEYQVVPLSPIRLMDANDNNNTTTPPCNGRSLYQGSSGFYEERCRFREYDRNYDRIDKENRSRHVLFRSPELDDEFGDLASCLTDSGMDCEESLGTDREDELFVVDSLPSSTPVVRPRQTRRIPKTKLHFGE